MAFSAFLLLAALILPYAIVSARDLRAVTVALGYIFVATVFFFMSVYRLHRQLVAAKQHSLAHVRDLYAQAFRPVENAWSLEALTAQAGRLVTIEVLQRQIAAIQSWPFDEAILARVTSVAGIIVARLILSRFGL